MSAEEWTFIGHSLILGAIAGLWKVLTDKIEEVLKIANGKTDKIREDVNFLIARIKELEDGRVS